MLQWKVGLHGIISEKLREIECGKGDMIGQARAQGRNDRGGMDQAVKL